MQRFLFIIVFFSFLAFGKSQTVLFEDDFNGCTLSSDWEVNLNGNQNFVWYVGTPLNPGSDSSSIDGTCMVVLDDDATGENSPAILAEFRTPIFDGSNFATVLFEADVSYRDFDQIDEYFEVVLWDGQTEHVLAHYEGTGQTGEQFSEFTHLTADLTLYSQSETMQIIFRYDDVGGGWGWYAGFDNVQIIGEGQGTPVLIETFNTCTAPTGWTTEILSGDQNWFFSNPPSTYYDANASMNGSCFVLFDDDFLGDSAEVSTVRLASPWFDGRDYASFQLDFDLIIRYWAETFSVYVENGDGDINPISSWSEDVGGPQFSNYTRQSFDISSYRHPQMRIVFEYNDGSTWSWWAGIDNVKITGNGVAHDICTSALPLMTDQTCQTGTNKTAIFEGPSPTCSEFNSSGVWFSWVADFTGEAELSLSSDFNDVVSVFSGSCSNLTWETCGNRDRYGFDGEKTYFQAQQGTQYFIRISGGKNERFGKFRGDFCIKIQEKAANIAPQNNPCATAIPIIIGGDCQQGNNKNADISNPNPSKNLRADADVWYSFVAPNLATDEVLRLESNADFSDIITVYEGSCQNAIEIQGTELGQRLDLENLTAGESYFIQISGNFATIEGNFCIKADIESINPTPNNTNCQQAMALPISSISDACLSGSLVNASFSGNHPPCIVQTKRDVWYSFIAPTNEAVYLDISATFKTNVGIWEGNCSNLRPFDCLENPTYCSGAKKLTGLTAGERYFIQLSATDEETGDFCIRILNANSPRPFEPLQLSVQTQCIGIDSAVLLVQANNGIQPYEWPANIHQQLLHSGEDYTVIVRDAADCEQAISGVAPDCDGAVLCAMTTQVANTSNPTCNDSEDGTISISTNNGVSPYSYFWNTSGIYTQNAENLAAGVYAVTVFDANGCSSSINQTLTAPSSIQIDISSIINPSNGQNNGSIEVIITGGTGILNAEWSDDSGNIIANTSNLEQIGLGTYNVVVTDENGCSNSETVLLNVSKTKETTQKNLLSISPNPAIKSTFILSDKSLGNSCSVLVKDASGKTVLSKKSVSVHQGQYELNVSNFAGGTYFVRLGFGKKVFTKRLIVVKK